MPAAAPRRRRSGNGAGWGLRKRRPPGIAMLAFAGLAQRQIQDHLIEMTASMRYNVDRSTQVSSRPASSGPTIAPNCAIVMFNEFAAGSCSVGRHPRDRRRPSW